MEGVNVSADVYGIIMQIPRSPVWGCCSESKLELSKLHSRLAASRDICLHAFLHVVEDGEVEVRYYF